MAGRTQRCCGRCHAPLPAPPRADWCAACGAPAPGSAAPVEPGRPARGGETRDRSLWNISCYVAWQVTREICGDIPPALRFPPEFKKRALLIGITYRKSWRGRLGGTINDVNSMSYLLQTKYDFPKESIIILTDGENSDSSRMPTRDNMEAAMRSLVKDCRSGYSLVFHYSGHCSQQKDKDGDELDGYDEVLCPMDHEQKGVIVDDRVHELMVQPLPVGAKLHAIVDACHSGSALDLPFVYSVGRNANKQWKEYSKSDRKTSGGWAICFSSCEDDQTSSETTGFANDNAMTGVMTYCFIDAVKNESGITYDHILQKMNESIHQRGLFRRRFSQVTQLSSSKKFDVRERVVL